MTLSLADGTRATIVSVTREKLASPQDVYNFEVADFHTYFVASAGVWVHNSCAGKWSKWQPRKSLGRDGGRAFYRHERDASGQTISFVQRVRKNGRVVHQHRRWTGRHGGSYNPPEAWKPRGNRWRYRDIDRR